MRSACERAGGAAAGPGPPAALISARPLTTTAMVHGGPPSLPISLSEHPLHIDRHITGLLAAASCWGPRCADGAPNEDAQKQRRSQLCSAIRSSSTRTSHCGQCVVQMWTCKCALPNALDSPAALSVRPWMTPTTQRKVPASSPTTF